MAGISAEVERTFVRLWTHCDDYGRCVDNPKLLKAALYPLHDDVTAEQIDNELEELFVAGKIIRYEGEGRALIAVPSWGEFQKPQRPTKSKFPEPSASSTRAFREPSANGGANGHEPTAETAVPRGVREPSASPPCRSGVEWSGDVDGEGGSSASAPELDEPAEPIPPTEVADRIRRHRWAGHVTPDEVNEAIHLLRTERIPDPVLLEALSSCDPFPSKWKARARQLHAERRTPPERRPDCPRCHRSDFVLDDAGNAIPCPEPHDQLSDIAVLPAGDTAADPREHLPDVLAALRPDHQEATA
jgi:hypothetical protein